MHFKKKRIGHGGKRTGAGRPIYSQVHNKTQQSCPLPSRSDILAPPMQTNVKSPRIEFPITDRTNNTMETAILTPRTNPSLTPEKGGRPKTFATRHNTKKTFQ